MIYIQSKDEVSLPHHFDAACALYGAEDLNRKHRLTSFSEVQSGKFDNLIRQHVFVGSVKFMREAFSRIGVDAKLPRNSNRQCEFTSLGEAHRRVGLGETIFVKPVQNKLFSGLVLDGCQYSCLDGLPDDTPIMVYKPFSSAVESEWRVYVHNHKIVDSRNYSGDFCLSPNYEFVRQIIQENKVDFPIAYTLDVGILANGESVVVEFNDMWAIGNYGVPNDLYVRMLTDRYFEIVKKYDYEL